MSDAIGFDLDMTLVDTRPGIRTALLAMAAETGHRLDADAIVARLGPPVADALAPYISAGELDAAIAVFRRHMARVGVEEVSALPGAAASLAAARAAGFRVIAVTSKLTPLAVATLAHAGLEVDEVHGGVWAADKAAPLRAAGAVAFVGDHPADMLAARTAGATAVGVTSGSSSAPELAAAGAAVVLDDLDGFPGWLAAQTAEVVVAERTFTESEARTVAAWDYPAPYDFYDMTGTDWHTIATREPDGAGYYPVLSADEVVGYVCFGAEARVVGQTVDADTCDVGMGIRPDRLSARIGSRALRSAVALGVRLFAPVQMRAAVAAFNERSLQLCRSAGFVAVREFDGPDGYRFVELVREP